MIFKIFFFLLYLVYPSFLYSHVNHYNTIKSIEMDVLRNGKKIGYNKYIFITPTIMNNPFINHKVYITLLRITKNYNLFYHYMKSNNIIPNINNDLQLYFQKNDLLDNTMNNMLTVFVNNN